MHRYFYADSISSFLHETPDSVLGKLTAASPFAIDLAQKDAWLQEISILKSALTGYQGRIFLEYSIPRIGRRIDAVVLIKHAVFILEFKVWGDTFASSSIDQVWDYALDLKNFHETSHSALLVPILVATEATANLSKAPFSQDVDGLVSPPLKTNRDNLRSLIDDVLRTFPEIPLDHELWDQGRYCPTPTIVEAAAALFSEHTVENISRSDAAARNLKETSQSIREVIDESQASNKKTICFVTGVPGAGKTLVGLDLSTKRLKGETDDSVFLSGNGPLVSILREALVRDVVRRAKERGEKLTKSEAMRRVAKFIQNVHNYRDEYLKDSRPPYDRVAIFDEAQRAWNLQQTAGFMRRKKGLPDFNQSEPEFLISCLDRHKNWAVIVCLVGGGQEINTGEAGIGEWLRALRKSFPNWNIHISQRLSDSEYGVQDILAELTAEEHVTVDDRLHLSVSMRSFRAENVSSLVKSILDIESDSARIYFDSIPNYPIFITRKIDTAKNWLRRRARGSERYGLLVSSSAERLKAKGINVRAPMDPVHWFLEGKDDVRSSYFLEEVATEFQVQGLELDWTAVVWDADLRFAKTQWQSFEFKGNRWNRINKSERQQFLKNAYRVLLTRARQGMIIVVPEGSHEDATRRHEFFDPTFQYLKSFGMTEI